MEIVFGTKNPGRLARMQSLLDMVGIHAEGLPDGTPSIEEDGESVLENATIKAMHFSKFTQKPVLSMDASLYLEGLPPEEQPSLFVRRVGHRLSDDELIEHYKKVFEKHGGKVWGVWKTGFALAQNGKIIKETTAESGKRLFVCMPSKKVTAGNPLDSLQTDPETGKYFSEMTEEELDLFWSKGAGQGIEKIFGKKINNSL